MRVSLAIAHARDEVSLDGAERRHDASAIGGFRIYLLTSADRKRAGATYARQGEGDAASGTQQIKGNQQMTGNHRSARDRLFQSRRGNNRSPVGNVLPRTQYKSSDVAKAMAEVLQGRFGNLKSPAKEMQRETGLNERACRNHLAGLNCMNLADFFNACQSSPELQAWGAMMMGLQSSGDPAFGKELARSLPTVLLRIEQGGGFTIEREEKP